MKKNMGSVDKIIRLIIAVVLGFLFYNGTLTGTIGIVAVVVAAVFASTSLVSYCPLYTLIGVNTCRVKK
jgi:uncharacterized membrane protein HdeD (DUF308 family)